uniref:Cold shock domain-containing protein 3-like n=1 Tax=Nicotiana tabacum TaxID=4097 RepID=A0A1S4B4A0_TOBAC
MAVETTRTTGTVSRFSSRKGYGFIKPDDGTEYLFVHQSAIKSDGFRSLYEGQKVEFTITGNGDKYQAINVTGPDGSPLNGSRNDGGGVRGNNRGGGGGGGDDCYTCRRIGHMARDCDHNIGGGGACYSCGMTGHIARECDRNSGGGGRSEDRECYNCGEYGHVARDCPSGKSVSDSGACYNCGLTGHVARDCSRESGGRGSSGGSSGACYTCGLLGHVARDCPSGRRTLRGSGSGDSGACYNCGLPGHVARDCSRESDRGHSGGDNLGRSGGRGSGGSKCYNCGVAGHFARECTNPAVLDNESISFDDADNEGVTTPHNDAL